MALRCALLRSGLVGAWLALFSPFALAQPAASPELDEAPAELTRGAGAASEAGAAAASRREHYRIELDAPSELLQDLRSKTLVGRWQTDPEFDPDQLPLFVLRAHEEAEAIARAAGYFAATASVTRSRGDDGLELVRIVLTPGPRTTVAQSVLELRGGAAGTAVEPLLLQSWPLAEGSVFQVDAWQQGKRQLLEVLQQRGYLRARLVDSRAEVDPGTSTARLRVLVDSGPRLGFGALSVRGLERYPRSIVDNLKPWGEGDPYAFDRLLAFQDRLREDGYFGGVSIRPDLAAVEQDAGRDTVPIIADLRERPAQRVTTGIGYSTDNGARALLGYTHRNVMGRGWVLDSGALLEQQRRRIFVDGRTPWEASGHRWQTGLRSDRAEISRETTDTQTVYFGRAGRRDDIEYFLSLQYQTELSSIDPGGGMGTQTARNRALTLGYAWTLRRLDSRLDPRRGYTITAHLSGAAKGLGSDASFVRVYARGMRFWPMPAGSMLDGGALIGLLEAGTVFADGREGIPSDNLFRAGGIGSIRGYRYQSLGVPMGEAVVGGRVLALASLEYQHPIVGNWYGAGFVDVGNAADRWSDWKAVRGTGVGLRWRSPIGPVHLDAAYGDQERRWRFHFSVGYTF